MDQRARHPVEARPATLCARIAWFWTTGETRLPVVERALPAIHVTVALTAWLGGIAATCRWLTGFPTRRHVGWVSSHGAERATRVGLTIPATRRGAMV